MDSVEETVRKWYGGIVPNFTRQELEYFKKDLAIKPWRFFVINANKEPLFKQVDALKSSMLYSKAQEAEQEYIEKYGWITTKLWLSGELNDIATDRLLMEELSKRFISDGCFAPAAYYYTTLKIYYFIFV